MSKLYDNCPPLRVSPSKFLCATCDRTWERGGHAEGFRKAAASQHRFSCWQKALAKRGLQIGDWNDKHQGHVLVPLRRVESTARGKER